MRKVTLFVFVFVLASLLAACAGAEAPADTAAPVPTQTARVEVVVVTATPAATEAVVPTITPQLYVIPLSWFASEGIIYKDGVTVAYNCEVGARAWQGQIPFTVVPTDANIELVEVNCIQYKPGESIPQAELDKMKGMGTIWFLLPIEGTESQKGDCPCVGEDC